MRQIKEVLRLAWESRLGAREIGRSLSIAHPTVLRYLAHAREKGLTWPLPAGMDDATLERCLAGRSSSLLTRRPQPDCATIHRELQQKGVTLQLLWQEYRDVHPSGYQYTQFCEHYRWFCKKLDFSLRQTHKAGEKFFVDYAGVTVPIMDPATGEQRSAQIFVAVLGASNYTFAEATLSQDLPSWILSHVRAFEFFGGVPAIVVPDNLKSAVTRPCRYEPEINTTYQEMALHYGTAIIPARVRKPKDKAKVEGGVLIVERWILAALRHQTFFHLTELNMAIAQLLQRLNHRPFKKIEGSRHSLFASLDQPALKPLPLTRYVYAEWKKARVGIDYHVEVKGHYYSVPYSLIREEIDIRLTATTVECFHKGARVASHLRSFQPVGQTTHEAHRPPSHQRYLEGTSSRVRQGADQIGPYCSKVIEAVFQRQMHPQQCLQMGLGILRLAKSYGNDRLETACLQATRLRSASYKNIASILKYGLDQSEPTDNTIPMTEATLWSPIEHSNIRGAGYYQIEDQETNKEENQC